MDRIDAFRTVLRSRGYSAATERAYACAVAAALRAGVSPSDSGQAYAQSLPPAARRQFLAAWRAYRAALEVASPSEEASVPADPDPLLDEVPERLVADGRSRDCARRAAQALRSGLRRIGHAVHDARALSTLLDQRSPSWTYLFRLGWQAYRALAAERRPADPPLPTLDPADPTDETSGLPLDVCLAIATLHDDCGIPYLTIPRLTWRDVDAGMIADRASGPCAYYAAPPSLAEALAQLRAWAQPASLDAPLVPAAPGATRPLPASAVRAAARSAIIRREVALGERDRARVASALAREPSPEEQAARRAAEEASAAIDLSALIAR